nr:MAG TPA: hypothetical protein [Caudoviricetes sp.]
MAVKIKNLGEMRKFNKLKKEIEEAQQDAPVKKEVDPIEKWSKRLSKLTGLSYEFCVEIAEEKLEYKEQEIQKLEERQNERLSVRRSSLIRKLERSNPLRYIKDKEHAYAIISASRRHNDTDYDEKLNLIHELERDGLIEKGNAKEIASTYSFNEIIDRYGYE